MNIERVWADIRHRLKTGTEIKGWSRDKGQTALTFKIIDIAPGSIIVGSRTLSKSRTIGKADFGKIAAVWSDYRQGKINRVETGKLSQNTSYIFGILKWLEDGD